LSADELVKQAHAHAVAGRLSQAIAGYRALLKRFPDDKRAAEWTKTLRRLRYEQVDSF
jgi:TolA-binding protein